MLDSTLDGKEEMTPTSNSQSIANALAEQLKTISIANGYLTDLGENVLARMEFWDSINEFPAIRLCPGKTTIKHLAGGLKHRYMLLPIRVFVQEEDSGAAIQKLLEDVERLVDLNGRLAYLDSSNNQKTTQDIKVLEYDNDQGIFDPLGIGEILLEVTY